MADATIQLDPALAWGTAQGGSTALQDGEPAPTVTPIAEVANGTGTAISPRLSATVRPAAAAASARAVPAARTTLSTLRAVYAGVPVTLHRWHVTGASVDVEVPLG